MLFGGIFAIGQKISLVRPETFTEEKHAAKGQRKRKNYNLK